jgi:hypothetical protein
MPDLIGVQANSPKFLKKFGHRAFAGCDTSGHSNHFHSDSLPVFGLCEL